MAVLDVFRVNKIKAELEQARKAARAVLPGLVPT
jgi:hypothetical protein